MNGTVKYQQPFDPLTTWLSKREYMSLDIITDLNQMVHYPVEHNKSLELPGVELLSQSLYEAVLSMEIPFGQPQYNRFVSGQLFHHVTSLKLGAPIMQAHNAGGWVVYN